MATSAVSRVFHIPDLPEAILLQLEPSPRKKRPEDGRTKQSRLYIERHGIHIPPPPPPPPPPVIQLFALQRVCRQFQATIVGSKALQRDLAFKKYTTDVGNLPSLMMLSNVKAGRGKISQAWASGKSGSWKTMKVNHPDSKSHALIYLHSDNWYQTVSNTTLGMVVEWELTVSGRQPEPLPVD